MNDTSTKQTITFDTEISLDVTEITAVENTFYALNLSEEATTEAVKRAVLYSPALSAEFTKFNGEVNAMLSQEGTVYELYCQKIGDDVSLRLTISGKEIDIDVEVPLNQAEQASFVTKIDIYEEAEIKPNREHVATLVCEHNDNNKQWNDKTNYYFDEQRQKVLREFADGWSGRTVMSEISPKTFLKEYQEALSNHIVEKALSSEMREKLKSNLKKDNTLDERN